MSSPHVVVVWCVGSDRWTVYAYVPVSCRLQSIASHSALMRQVPVHHKTSDNKRLHV